LHPYFRSQENNRVYFSEICPSAALNLKWRTQRTQVRFRYHFSLALLRKNFASRSKNELGEISGLETSVEKMNPEIPDFSMTTEQEYHQ